MRSSALAAVLLLASVAAPAATYVVDTTTDSTVGLCTGAPNDCTLRGATTRAQNSGQSPGEDLINFNIPANDPGCDTDGVCTIRIGGALGGLTLFGSPAEGITIDGYSQPGASVNSLPVGQGSNAQLKIVLAPIGASSSFDV